MKPLLLIAKDNIKKKKTDAIIMLLLIAIATLFFYVSVSVLTNYTKVIDSRNEENNGASFMYYTASDRYDEIFDLLDSKEQVTESERENVLYGETVKYRKEGEKEEDAQEIDILFFNKDTERNISKFNVIDAKGEWTSESIIIPYYLHVAQGYNAGDTIYIKKSGVELEFKIYGYSEDVIFSNPMNVSILKVAVSDEMFNKQLVSISKNGNMYKAKIDGSTETFEKEAEEGIASLLGNDTSNLVHIALNYDVMKVGTGMVVLIFMALLTVFAILLILVVLIIIKFNINNSIEENIKNTGIMEACGYTSIQMIIATILEFGIVGLAGCIIGLIGAYSASNFIGNIISSSMGLLWKMKFSVISAILAVVLIIGFIAVVAYLSARKFRKITPLDALRNGINSHNFKKNRLKLESSPFGVNSSLGIKSTLFNLKKNVFICIVVVILTFVTCMSVASFTSFVDKNTLLEMAGVEYTDVQLGRSDNSIEKMEEIYSILESKPEVKKILRTSGLNVSLVIKDEEEQIYLDSYDKPQDTYTDILVEGRFPEFENEIVINGHVAKKCGLEIGDTLMLKFGDNSAEYIVVGLSQGFSRMGMSGIITLEGEERIYSGDLYYVLYVYFNDDVDVNAMIAEYNEIYGKDYTIIDYSKAMEVTIGPLSVTLKAFCVALVSVSAIVIALILILLIKSHIIREKKHMGILKAIGYTTPQLIVQIMVSYLPVVLIGGIIGGIITSLFVENIFVLVFSMFTIKKIAIATPFYAYIICVVGILVWSEIVALISSVKIKKIMPYKMITEQ